MDRSAVLTDPGTVAPASFVGDCTGTVVAACVLAEVHTPREPKKPEVVAAAAAQLNIAWAAEKVVVGAADMQPD